MSTEDASRRTRNHRSPAEKVAILRRHLIDRVPISDLCDELGLNPTQVYAWQKTFFEQGAAAFEQTAKTSRRATDAKDRKIAALELKLATKDL